MQSEQGVISFVFLSASLLARLPACLLSLLARLPAAALLLVHA
jgi:hypothetical protein